MKKTLLFKQLALAAALAVPVVGNGQKVLVEDFAYSAGNLVGQGDWTQILSAATNPLQVAGEGLIYPDYQDESIGGSATFQSTGQDAYLPLGRDITSGDVYVSALVRLHAVQAGNAFFTFAGAEPATSNLRGKLFAKASDNGKALLGVARQATSATSTSGNCAQFATTECDLDSIYLVVMKYSFIEGEKNIKVKMISKLMEGTYPNYRQVVPVELKHSLALSREELLNAVARAELMTSERSHIVNLSFGNNQLTISSHSAEVGEAKETLMINHEGPEIVISFNPTFLMDPLKTLDDSEIYLEINDEFSPALLRAKENSKFVVMPMRPPTA